MLIIDARNINDAWEIAKRYLNARHVVRPSRVGEVWEFPDPVMTIYHHPVERVLFSPSRNANPYFHLFEALWMLAGRDDVEWIAQFLPRMREFSDDGVTLTGAYGFRWRDHFNLYGGDGNPDQLSHIVSMLQRSHHERRAVLTMFDPTIDLDTESKDVPCNTQCYFKVRDERLDMMVTCRSNDIAWGAYGSNVVHFSMLLEYMAARIGIPVGTYYHLSDSWHAYTERWESLGGLDMGDTLMDPYSYGATVSYASDGESVQRVPQMFPAEPYPLVDHPGTFDGELSAWMTQSGQRYGNTFFDRIATPMLNSWLAWKNKNWEDAFSALDRMPDENDWSLATQAFLTRRMAKATVA